MASFALAALCLLSTCDTNYTTHPSEVEKIN